MRLRLIVCSVILPVLLLLSVFSFPNSGWACAPPNQNWCTRYKCVNGVMTPVTYPCGSPVLALSSFQASVLVDDIPMVCKSALGPPFEFRMRYSNQDNRNRTNNVR